MMARLLAPGMALGGSRRGRILPACDAVTTPRRNFKPRTPLDWRKMAGSRRQSGIRIPAWGMLWQPREEILSKGRTPPAGGKRRDQGCGLLKVDDSVGPPAWTPAPPGTRGRSG